MSFTDSSLVCQQAYEYNANVWIILVFCIVLVLNVLGLASTIHVSRILLSTQVEVFHINLRILFANLSLALVIRSALTLYRAGQHLYLNLTYTSTCDFLQSARYCDIQSTLTSSPVLICVYAYLLIALERSVSTYSFRTYEKRRDIVFTLIIATAAWYHPVYNVVVMFIGDSAQEDPKPYCSSMTSKSNVNMMEKFLLPIIVIVICFVLFVIILRFCIEKTRMTQNTQQQLSTLSGRFQLNENIRASRIVLPNAFLFLIVCGMNIAVLFLFNAFIDKSNMKLYGILKEISSLTFPIYINLYSWIFILRCPAVARRTYFIRRFTRFTKEPLQEQIMGSNNHFSMLNNYWK